MSQTAQDAGTVDATKVLEMAGQELAKLIDDLGLKDNPIMQGVMDGLTVAQAMGLTREDLEVLYAVGFQKLNAGDVEAARDMFGYLVMIDPLHAPNHYCLGVVFQKLGQMQTAEAEFVNFLALDATNPAGYLRYGECCQARGAVALAREAYELAEAECRNGHGDEMMIEEARAKLALLKETQA